MSPKAREALEELLHVLAKHDMTIGWAYYDDPPGEIQIGAEKVDLGRVPAFINQKELKHFLDGGDRWGHQND